MFRLCTWLGMFRLAQKGDQNHILADFGPKIGININVDAGLSVQKGNRNHVLANFRPKTRINEKVDARFGSKSWPRYDFEIQNARQRKRLTRILEAKAGQDTILKSKTCVNEIKNARQRKG